MKINGIQYYWLIALGLITGQILGLVLGFAGEIPASDPTLVVFFVAALLYALVSILVATLEVRDRHGILAAIAMLVITPLLLLYWFSRINGVE